MVGDLLIYCGHENPSKEKIEEIMDKMDHDKDKKVTKEEFSSELKKVFADLE